MPAPATSPTPDIRVLSSQSFQAPIPKLPEDADFIEIQALIPAENPTEWLTLSGDEWGGVSWGDSTNIYGELPGSPFKLRSVSSNSFGSTVSEPATANFMRGFNSLQVLSFDETSLKLKLLVTLPPWNPAFNYTNNTIAWPATNYWQIDFNGDLVLQFEPSSGNIEFNHIMNAPAPFSLGFYIESAFSQGSCGYEFGFYPGFGLVGPQSNNKGPCKSCPAAPGFVP